MASLLSLNPRADLLRSDAARQAVLTAAVGLASVLRSNLGPQGTYKMLVGGALQTKITRDGNVILSEIQIQHPIASMIARAATAQDKIVGDGCTSLVLLIGELLKNLIQHKVHPRILCEGIEFGKDKALEFLAEFRILKPNAATDSQLLLNVARTSITSKLESDESAGLSCTIVEAVKCLASASAAAEVPLDLHMIEVMMMKQGHESKARLVRGIVMDHGPRHPDMPTKLDKCYVLTCNVSLEYEKSEVNSGFFYSSAEQRESLVIAERTFTDKKVAKIIELKEQVCADNKMGFVVLNQKGIDPPSLDMLAKAGIMALRRVKRRNMERIPLCCGGVAVNSVEDLTPDVLGQADKIWEENLGDDKFTFLEVTSKPISSCTILIKGQTQAAMDRIKDAVRSALRAVKIAIEDEVVVPGAGAFELALHDYLTREVLGNKEIVAELGLSKLGVEAFANALLVIPKVLAENSGYDAESAIVELQAAYSKGFLKAINKREVYVGFDKNTGKPFNPTVWRVWDLARVKRQQLSLLTGLVQQLSLVDEIIRAGKSMKGGSS